jgi:NADPH2:quinone reductase
MRGFQVTRFGGPDVLTLADLPEPVADQRELVVQVDAAGVNFADTSRIRGSYRPTPELPFVPGAEVVGRTREGRRVLASGQGRPPVDAGLLAHRNLLARRTTGKITLRP